MSAADYRDTTAKKRADTAKGRQHSPQPKHAAEVTKAARLESLPVTELRKKAAAAAIPGRARMNKAALVHALERA